MDETHEVRDRAEGFLVELSAQECWQLLSRVRFGRVALSVGGDTDIFPIDFAVDGTELVFRTTEGTKLVEVVLSNTMTIEADERDLEQRVAWSVVVKGVPVLLDTFTEIDAAERLDIRPWTGTPKHRFVRLTQTRISGRRAYAPIRAAE